MMQHYGRHNLLLFKCSNVKAQLVMMSCCNNLWSQFQSGTTSYCTVTLYCHLLICKTLNLLSTQWLRILNCHALLRGPKIILIFSFPITPMATPWEDLSLRMGARTEPLLRGISLFWRSELRIWLVMLLNTALMSLRSTLTMILRTPCPNYSSIEMIRVLKRFIQAEL